MQPMTEEMALKCDLLEELVEELETKTGTLRRPFNFESYEEALNLMALACRQVLGVVALARTGFHLLPPADVAARAAYEASVRAAWMLRPDDPMECEVRWLAHLLGEVNYLDKEIDEGTKEMGINMDEAESRRDGIARFHAGVSKQLERGYRLKKGLPPIPEMLIEIGERKTYAIYSLLCQTAHGGHYSTWIFRGTGVGTQKTHGEFITQEKWNVPLAISRFAFKGPAAIIFNRFRLDYSGLAKLLGP